MKILIVGGTSSLAHALKPMLSSYAEVLTAGRVGCDVTLDLSDPLEKFTFPDGIDVVINTAAYFGGKTPQEMFQTENVNVLGALKLCQASIQAGVKQLVQVSSIFADLDRDSPFYSLYSLSKRHADELAQFYCAKFDLPLFILRPSQFYGVGEANRKHQPFFYSIIDKAEKGEDILIQGSHDALRNFIHIEDVAEVILRVVQRGLEGKYPCVSTENLSFSGLAAAAILAFGSRSQIKFLKEQPDIPDNIFPPDESLFRLIDYYPQITISRGMEKEAVNRKAAK